ASATTEIYTLSLHDALPIYFSRSKFEKLLEVCRKNSGGKILVFNQRVKGARILFEFLRAKGFTQTALITGSTKGVERRAALDMLDRKSTRLNSSHVSISYAV